jgi:hypothetical protein
MSSWNTFSFSHFKMLRRLGVHVLYIQGSEFDSQHQEKIIIFLKILRKFSLVRFSSHLIPGYLLQILQISF